MKHSTKYGFALFLTSLAFALTARAGIADITYGVQVPLPDGKVLKIGSETRLDGPGWLMYSIAVGRIGTDGLPDASFGNGGLARIPVFGEYEFVVGHVLQPDGKIVVAAGASDPAGYDEGSHPCCRDHSYVGVSRLNPDGSIDLSFNQTGRLIFEAGEFDYPNVLAIEADGKITVRGLSGAALARIRTDGTFDPAFNVLDPMRVREAGFVTLIEYRNANDQYFLSGNPDEFVLLDNQISPGWSRTGYGMHVYPAGNVAGRGVPVCRFYGEPELGLGNHFFTADPVECASLAADPRHAWMLESTEAFRVDIPSVTTGACAEGQSPIFRLLALRRDSAHRYTANVDVRATAIHGGWLAEGYGPMSVAMCGPS